MYTPDYIGSQDLMQMLEADELVCFSLSGCFRLQTGGLLECCLFICAHTCTHMRSGLELVHSFYQGASGTSSLLKVPLENICLREGDANPCGLN